MKGSLLEQKAVTLVQNINIDIISLFVFSNHACRLPSNWCNLEDWILLFADLESKSSNNLESYLATSASAQK